MTIDPTEMIRGIVRDMIAGVSSSIISGKFHRTIASLIIATCEAIRSEAWVEPCRSERRRLPEYLSPFPRHGGLKKFKV